MPPVQLPLPLARQPWRRPGAVPAKPFVKWAGGKTQLLGDLASRAPAAFGRYFEPFCGGAAFFFALQPRSATLSDANAELIQLYEVVRDDVDALVAELSRHRYDKDSYYRVRALDPATLRPVARAARMLYLNRTCFNGLYRVNRSGAFNVPMGRYANPTICDVDGLRAASLALAGHAIARRDYRAVLDDARPGDFVYFDPPYQPVSATANFTSYTPWPFVEADQRQLADTFDLLSARGVHCMLTNSDTPLVRALYAHHRIDRVLATRRISRDAARRGPVGELIVRNYSDPEGPRR